MIKSFITVLFTLFFFSSIGQNHQPSELGIGFVISTNPYQYENLSHPSNIYSDKELSEKSTNNKIFPFFYKPDYGLYHFICLEKTKEYYKVLINDSNTAFIPNDNKFYFQTWDRILLQSTVERISNNNPIRKKSLIDSDSINYNCDYDRLIVTDIIEKNGVYWLSVEFSTKCEDYPNENSIMKHGWIIWRTDDKLLVRIMLLC